MHYASAASRRQSGKRALQFTSVPPSVTVSRKLPKESLLSWKRADCRFKKSYQHEIKASQILNFYWRKERISADVESSNDDCLTHLRNLSYCTDVLYMYIDRSMYPRNHRLNMELDLQCLIGLRVHSCTQWLRTPQPPPLLFGLIYEGAIGQPRKTTSQWPLALNLYFPLFFYY